MEITNYLWVDIVVRKANTNIIFVQNKQNHYILCHFDSKMSMVFCWKGNDSQAFSQVNFVWKIPKIIPNPSKKPHQKSTINRQKPPQRASFFTIKYKYQTLKQAPTPVSTNYRNKKSPHQGTRKLKNQEIEGPRIPVTEISFSKGISLGKPWRRREKRKPVFLFRDDEQGGGVKRPSALERPEKKYIYATGNTYVAGNYRFFRITRFTVLRPWYSRYFALSTGKSHVPA